MSKTNDYDMFLKNKEMKFNFKSCKPISLNIKYLDKNMGMFLIIWDRMFGTFQAEEDETEYEKLKFGLTKPLEDKGPINIIFHEWKEIYKDFFHRKKHETLK